MEIRDLTFGYDDVVLSDISLTVTEGEVLAVMGRNGSGKTTLLKLIAGLYDPDEGSISHDGVVGFSPEDPTAGLFAETVAEEVAFFPRNRGLDVEEHATKAMRAMDIADLEDRGPHTLSVGEQRRVSIAAVLAGAPATVTLDEPTAGLDRAGQQLLGDLLADIDPTVVFSTHDADFAFEVADRVAIIEGGRLSRVDDTRAVLTDIAVLSDAGIRPPEVVTWSRDRGFDHPPANLTEAVSLLRRRE